MSLFSKIKDKIRRPSAKQLVMAGVFTLALACSVGAGLAVRGTTSAIETRQCGTDSVDNDPHSGPGCGALTGSELITDIKQNTPLSGTHDLPVIYSTLDGITSNLYTQYANTAQTGSVNIDGTVTFNGQTVMTDVQTYGRDKFNSHRVAQQVGGTTLYHAAPQFSFASGVNAIPVLIMFNDKGVAMGIVEKPCGNPVTGHPVVPSATCKAINVTQSGSNPNTYNFTAQAPVLGGNATFDHVVYTVTDGAGHTVFSKSSTSLTAPVSYTFTADGTVTATIFAKVPGGHVIQATAVAACAKHIIHVAPHFVCTALTPTAIDDNTFRFTIHTNQDSHTTVKSADFTLDGSAVTKNVTTQDSNGNIFKEYSFTDTTSHTVSVTVFFNTLEGVKSDSGHCKATVTPKQKPMCTIPGRTNLPPDSPQCAFCQPGIPVGSSDCFCKVPGHTTEAPDSPTCGFCQPGVPIGSPQCTPPNTPPPSTPPTQLTNTGPGQTIGLFFGVSILGFFAHKLFLSRRLRRLAADQIEVAPTVIVG